MTGYYHEFMLKDRPHLCQYMPPCKDARRLVADPNNEPNFYRISRQYPLDGEAPIESAVDSPLVKRMRSDSMSLPQGLALGAAALVGAPVMPVMAAPGAAGLLGAPSPAALLGLVNPNAAPVTPVLDQRAALLSILEAQNKQREEEKHRALLAAALMQQQQRQHAVAMPSPAPSHGEALAAVLGLFGQR